MFGEGVGWKTARYSKYLMDVTVHIALKTYDPWSIDHPESSALSLKVVSDASETLRKAKHAKRTAMLLEGCFDLQLCYIHSVLLLRALHGATQRNRKTRSYLPKTINTELYMHLSASAEPDSTEVVGVQWFASCDPVALTGCICSEVFGRVVVEWS